MLSNLHRLELQSGIKRISGTHYQNLTAKPRRFTTTPDINKDASRTDPTPYWTHVRPWKEVPAADFLNYGWQVRYFRSGSGHIVDTTDHRNQKSNTIERPEKLLNFLDQILPSRFPDNRDAGHQPITTREAFLSDVEGGMKVAPMSVRLTPHIMSVANWTSPFDDPIIRQFLPLKSNLLPDHPELTLDSLHEEGDSPVPGLVHRYPDKVLFLGK
jgi:lysine 2,3-aminomutase